MNIKLLIIDLGIGIILVGVFLLISNISMNTQNLDKNQFFELVELKTVDVRYAIRGTVNTKKNIVIVGIDEKSLNKLGKWPWKRDIHAKLVDKLTELKVKSIGFDISFTEPAVAQNIKELKKSVLTLYREKKIDKEPALEIAKKIKEMESNEDEVFSESIAKSGRVSIGTYSIDAKENNELSQSQLDNTTYYKSRFNYIHGAQDELNEVKYTGSGRFRPNRIYKILPPIQVIGDACFGVAHLEVGRPSIDGTFRDIPMVMSEDVTTAYFAPLFLMVYLRAYDMTLEKNVLLDISKTGIGIYEDASKNKNLLLRVNTLKNGQFNLNFYGPAHTFKYVPYIDVINGDIDPAVFKDKIALIGYTDTAKGLYDLRATPVSTNMPGIELHATAIQNMIDKKFLQRLEAGENVIILIIGILLFSILFSIKSLNFREKNIIAISMIIIYVFIAQILFNYGIWIHLFYPVLTFFTIYLISTIQTFFSEEIEKKKIKHAFKHYINPDLIEQLLKNPEKLKLGGEKKILTVMFTDIKGFTTISEGMNPEQLVEFLNEYLSAMTDIIMENKGMVDKYEGDAIMAIFGAPLYIEDNAKCACIAAIKYQTELKRLRKVWQDRGFPPIHARIGINTGEMVVGNMGSKNKFDYTVIGDEVNLASRLEGANKEYDTGIMISYETYKAVSDIVIARELDVIRVKGKLKPVDVYELINTKEALTDEQKELMKRYSKGLVFYKMREWEEAIKEFKRALEIEPEDGPSKRYIERCEYFRINPPDEDWDGVYTFTTK